LFGMQVGANTLILGNMELSGSGNLWKKLRIGRHCQITAPLYVDLNAEITIGEHVALAHHVKLVTTSHDATWQKKRCGTVHIAPMLPVLIWRYPQIGIYILFGGSLLFPSVPSPAIATMPTSFVPFWWNLSSAGFYYSHSTSLGAIVISPAEILMLLTFLTWLV